MLTVLLAAAGAAVGAVLRLLVGRALPGRPGTLLVNVTGSLLLGLLVGAAPPQPVLVLLGAGACGGLTTFSTFAVEGGGAGGARYVALTVASCVAAAVVGLRLTA